jgi:hypothetical protein
VRERVAQRLAEDKENLVEHGGGRPALVAADVQLDLRVCPDGVQVPHQRLLQARHRRLTQVGGHHAEPSHGFNQGFPRHVQLAGQVRAAGELLQVKPPEADGERQAHSIVQVPRETAAFLDLRPVHAVERASRAHPGDRLHVPADALIQRRDGDREARQQFLVGGDIARERGEHGVQQ